MMEFLKSNRKILHYGLDFQNAYVGQIIESPYEITVDSSWLNTWAGVFYSGNYLETSLSFCQDLDLKDRVIPFSALNNLCLCMAVEPFSETCLLHLGINDAINEYPAYLGDTFRCYILIEEIRNTSDQKRSVMKTQHILLNQKSERVLSFKRKTLFPYILDIKKQKDSFSKPEHLGHFTENIKAWVMESNSVNTAFDKRHLGESFQKNDLVLHEAVRHFSETENLTLSTLLKNTHPIHFNYARYSPQDIIVSGGFVMAMVMSLSMKDFKQVLSQRIAYCSHLNKVKPGDTIAAVTFIIDSVINDSIEVLTLKTLGFKNIDTISELGEMEWPKEVFALAEMKPSELNGIIGRYTPKLDRKAILQLQWEISRPIKLNQK